MLIGLEKGRVSFASIGHQQLLQRPLSPSEYFLCRILYLMPNLIVMQPNDQAHQVTY